MFSGIVETLGTIMQRNEQEGCVNFTIKSHMEFTDLKIGDSVCVNGVCLTVTEFQDQLFSVTAVPETLRLTNISQLKTNDTVNLERSLTLSARIGGHYVQGHIDNTGQIDSIQTDNDSKAWLVRIKIPDELAYFIVKKGYITIDGMSITVIDVGNNWFTVSFIPHTQNVTIVQHYRAGQLVNIEVDILGKYVTKYLGASQHAQLH